MPEWRVEVLRRLARARLRPEREAAIADEVAQHLDDRYRALIAAGYTAEAAERASWRELDESDMLGQRLAGIDVAPPSLAHLETAPSGHVLRSLRQDLRYALRSLLNQPLLATTVVVTLALSLGPTTAVLGVANALFVRPVPGIADQHRLLNVAFGSAREQGYSPWFISYANAADITRDATTVTAMAGHQPVDAAIAADGAAPRRERGAAVSVNYFGLLGVRPVAGRDFVPDDDGQPGGAPVVLVSERVARTLFESSGTALGRSVVVNGTAFTVIGIMPEEFAGTDINNRASFWVTGMAYARATNLPTARWRYGTDRGPFYLFVVRMAPGATVAQTTAELLSRTRAIADRDLEQGNPFRTVGPILQPGFAAPASLRPVATRAMSLIGTVAGLLVLLGVANVANLLIFRGVATRRDVAIRKALGASAGRLVQLRLIESLLLAFAGASAGIAIAVGLNRALSGLQITGVGLLDVALDWRTLLAASAVAVVVGVGCGLAPAVLAVRQSVTGAIGRGVRHGGVSANRVRHALASVQVALSLTLLVGALLFLVTLQRLHAVDLGFDPADVVTVNLSLRGYGYTDARSLEYERQIADALGQRPGMTSIAIAYSPPLIGGSFYDRVYLPDQDPKQAREVPINGVSAGYFTTLGLPLLHGRAFTTDEAFNAAGTDPMPVVLSATLARDLFGSTDAVDRELRLPGFQAPPTTLRVIGVTRESHFGGIDSPPDAVLYEPLARFPLKSNVYVIGRSALGQAPTSRMIADVAKSLDPAIALAPERTMGGIIDMRLAQQRLFAWTLGALGTIGFVLAAVGLHGLVAQTVTERRRELGIRVAIGADRWRIMRLVLRQAAVVVSVGLAAGLTMAWFAGRYVESRLYGVDESRSVVVRRRGTPDDRGRRHRERPAHAGGDAPRPDRGSPRRLRSDPRSAVCRWSAVGGPSAVRSPCYRRTSSAAS